MVVKVQFGRRMPKHIGFRAFARMRGFVDFQEQVWVMIKSSMKKMKNKVDKSDFARVTVQNEDESLDQHYKIIWKTWLISCDTPDQEEEEYQEALQLFDRIGSKFAKKIPGGGESMLTPITSKIMNKDKLDKMYSAGYTNMEKTSMHDKLLEMGILSSVEKIKLEEAQTI